MHRSTRPVTKSRIETPTPSSVRLFSAYQDFPFGGLVSG
jgi:hypothetical protein